MAKKDEPSVGEQLSTDPEVQKLIDAALETCTKNFQESVDKIIAEAIKSFVTSDQVAEMINGATSDLITKDQWNEALEGMLSTPVSLSGIHPGMEIMSQFGRQSVEPIPAEHLSGLVFRSSKQKKTETGKVHSLTERQLTPDDVLTWKDNGDTVTIISADGQKHTVEKE